ncbi:MAG: hypothetical protein EAY81_11205, partial [Bacteroidetes bacterium]
MTSPDGINWTIRTSAADNRWYSVTYGNGVFVAVAESGIDNRVMTSPNGINWTIRTSAANNEWGSVTYGNGIFVAVATTGTGNRVMTSPDGINWTSRTSASDSYWYSVIHSNGIFVAVGEVENMSDIVMTSSPTLVTPSVTIGANPGNSVATGTSVTFTATPINGGSTPAYQWKKNGNNVGANSVNYTDAALQHGDIITCVLTSNDPCASPTIATSNGISMIIPGIGLVGTISAMATPVGTASASQSFTVSGSSLTNNIVVTPPTGFEVSLSANSGYGASVSLPQSSGTVNPTTVFVRLAAATAIGTYSGNIVCSSTGFTSKNITIPSSQVGIQASALNFDGVNDVVQVAAATTKFDLPALTGECWVKRDAMNGTNVCLFASRSTTAARFSVHMGNNSIGLFNGATFATVNTISFAANTWYHIAVVLRTTGGMDVYVNGSYAGTTSNFMGTTTNLPFQIGSSIPNGTFESLNGTLDELRIWNTARTASEIANNYLSVISNPSGQANLISYYNFNNGVSNGSNAAFATLTDLANNPLNGTLTNFGLTGSTSNWVESYAMVVPTATAATNITSTGFTANWTAPTTGTVSNYLLDVSTNSNFTSFVSGYNGLSVTGTSATVTGLAANNLRYYYRVRANNSSLPNQGGFSNTITAITTTLVQPGNALNFDGTNDYVDLGTNPLLAATNFKTIECWVRFNNFNNQEILSKSIAGSGTELLVFNGNLGYFNMNATSGAVSFINYATSNLATGVWYHIAAAWNGLDRATMRLYVNGVAVGTRTDVGALTNGNTNPAGSFRIGTWSDASGGRFFNGNIDEVRIWSSERTATQIANNYRTIINNPSSEANLLAYYNFDNGIAGGNNAGVTNLPDLTTNNLNGTLTNFTLNGNTSNWVNSTITLASPTITSFTPLSAKPSDVITITGTNFNTTPANNIVFFGATRATVTAATATSLTVTVPLGATYAPITVLNISTSLAANSAANFNPIYSPAKTNITSTDFAAMVDFVPNNMPRYVAIGDLDGDGKPDMVVANTSSSSISVFRNTSNNGSISASSFATKVDFTTATNPVAVVISDLDGDGKPDLVIANSASNSVSVLRNTSSVGSITVTSFAAKVDFATGLGPSALAVGDLDGDGKPDLAATNQSASSNSVSIIRNTSTVGSITATSFAAKIDFATGINPNSVAIGDLDGDGKHDLVVTNSSSNTLSVFRNLANGMINANSFASKVDFITASSPRSVIIGDLDGDGKPELVIANGGTTSVSVFRNTATNGSIGASSFATNVNFITGTAPRSVVIGDVDGDGKPDLIATNQVSNTVSILRNTSTNGIINSSSFAAKVDLPTGTSPFSVAIGDLDGDGKPDLVTANNGSNNISVLRNTDVILPPTITSFTPLSAKPGDVVTITGTNFNTTPANNIVFLGATRATVTAATATNLTVTVPSGATYAPITVLNTSTSLAAYSLANFNPIYSPAKTGITINDFAARVDFTTGVSSALRSAAISDLDGDGQPDLVVTNPSLNTVSVYRNTATNGSIGLGSFATKVDFTTSTNPRSIAIGDLDGDGKLDLVVANAGSNNVSVYRNTATNGSIDLGSFAAKVDFTTNSNPLSVTIGDLDGDGKAEVVTTNYFSSNVSIFRNTSTNGTIGFATKQDFSTGTNSQPSAAAIGDLDGDGKHDLAVTNYNSNTVSVFRNTSTSGVIGSNSFAAKQDFATDTKPILIKIGDLDGDSKPDLAVVNSGINSSSVSIFHNTTTSGSISSSSFSVRQNFPTGTLPCSVAIGDLDGDNKPDLVTANFNSNTVSVFRNTSTSGIIGSNSFATKQDFATGTATFSVAIGDLDGDGKPDLVTANGGSNNISVLRNAEVVPPPTIT